MSAPDWDREFARLLAEHHAQDEPRHHAASCPCCAFMAEVVANLRRDLWSIAEGRRP